MSDCHKLYNQQLSSPLRLWRKAMSVSVLSPVMADWQVVCCGLEFITAGYGYCVKVDEQFSRLHDQKHTGPQTAYRNTLVAFISLFRIFHFQGRISFFICMPHTLLLYHLQEVFILWCILCKGRTVFKHYMETGMVPRHTTLLNQKHIYDIHNHNNSHGPQYTKITSPTTTLRYTNCFHNASTFILTLLSHKHLYCA